MTDLSIFFDFPTTRLDFVSDVIDPQPDHRAPELAETNGYPYVGIRDINSDGSINVQTARKVKLEAVKKQELAFRLVPGDIVFCKVGTLGLPRRIKPIPQIALSATLVLIKPQAKVDSQFLFYALDSDSIRSQCDLESTGSTRQALGIQQIRRFNIPFTSLEAQKSIARFLDRKTAAIDTLIAKNQRLIQLLEEKRTALINQAATKGLNPNALMKDSGIPWIGEIPEHWSVKRLKFVCTLETGHTPSKSEPIYWIPEECTIPWVSLNDTKTLEANDFIEDTKLKINQIGMANSSAHLINAGAVVFNRDGARVGLCAITTKPMAVSQHMIAWVCKSEVHNYFILHVMYAMAPDLRRIAAGSTIPTIGMDDVKSMVSPIPPLNEQHEIINYPIKNRTKIEQILLNIKNQIEKLQEYRRSLITAAVTGKLDIRNLNQET